MNTHHFHISPRELSAQQPRLPAAARPWCGVRRGIGESRFMRTAFKVTTVTT